MRRAVAAVGRGARNLFNRVFRRGSRPAASASAGSSSGSP